VQKLAWRERVFVLAALAVLAAGFAVAYAIGESVVVAATLGLAAVAATAGLGALLELGARARRDARIEARLEELAGQQRRLLAETTVGKPEPTVLFLVDESTAAAHLRIERRRPRPLDLEQTVDHERLLALRTLPSAQTPLAGSLHVYRGPTDHDRSVFREQVERYAAELREALSEYDLFRQERALLVRGRFRFENRGRRTVHNVVVRVSFPHPFAVVEEAHDRPALPRRPTFQTKRAALAALLGGDPRSVPSEQQPPPSGQASRRLSVDVSPPRYRHGSADLEVSVERLPPSLAVDMPEEDRWVLRLPRSGEYRIPWTMVGDELEEPVRGELRLTVAELLDDTPIRSIKELLDEDGAAGP
jgi:hypothetical protein